MKKGNGKKSQRGPELLIVFEDVGPKGRFRAGDFRKPAKQSDGPFVRWKNETPIPRMLQFADWPFRDKENKHSNTILIKERSKSKKLHIDKNKPKQPYYYTVFPEIQPQRDGPAVIVNGRPGHKESRPRR